MSHTRKTPPIKVPTSDLPTDVYVGTIALDTTTNEQKVFNGTDWSVVQLDHLNSPTIVFDSTGPSYDQIQGDIPTNWKVGEDTLTGLVIGTSCETIYDRAFEGCTGLVGDLVIPDSVSTIENLAFYNCIGLSDTLTISSNVTKIDFQAFSNCTNITNVNCYVEKSVLDFGSCLLGSGVITIHVRSTDTTWTAGSGQTIGGKSGITVIKDL